MKMKITLHGVAYEVDVEVLDEGEGFLGTQNATVPQVPKIIPSAPMTPSFETKPVQPQARTAAASGPDAKHIGAPVGGIIVEVKMKPGDKVLKGQEILVLEAMKMHTSIAAPAEGIIKTIPVAAGDTVREGQVLVEFE